MECLLASWYTHLTRDSYTVTFCFVFNTQLQHFITKTNRIASQQTNAISNTNSSSVKLLHKHFSLCLSTKRFISLLLFPNFMCFVPHTLLLYFLFHIGNWKTFFHQVTSYMQFYHTLQSAFEKWLIYKPQCKDRVFSNISLTKTDLNMTGAPICLPSGPLNSVLLSQLTLSAPVSLLS